MNACTGLRDRQRRFAFRDGGDTRAHQPAAIEHDPHRLAALGLVLARDRNAAARRRGPADVAQVIAFAVFTEAFKIAAESALPRLAQLQIDLAAAREK